MATVLPIPTLEVFVLFPSFGTLLSLDEEFVSAIEFLRPSE